MPVLLALDLSQSVGWACGDPDEPKSVAYGTIRLPSGNRGQGAVLAACMDGVADLLRTMSPDWIVCEAPLPIAAQTHANTARQQWGLAACMDLLAYRWEIQIREVTPDAARLSVLGKSRFGGRDKAKEAVMAWCRQQGYRPPTDDAGDALVVLHHGWQAILGKHVQQKISYPGRPAVG